MNERNSESRLPLSVRAKQPFGCVLALTPAAPGQFTHSSAGGRLLARKRVIDSLSLWFSLPLVIWLSSGWIGLLGHWQALAGFPCLMEKLRPAVQLTFRSLCAGGDFS